MEILLINTRPLVFDQGVTITEEDKQFIVANCSFCLQYQDAIDKVALQIGVRYWKKNGEKREPVASTAGVMIAQIDGWESLEKEEENIRNNADVQSLLKFAFAFMEGYIFKASENTPLANSFVGNPNYVDIFNGFKIEKVQPNKEDSSKEK